MVRSWDRDRVGRARVIGTYGWMFILLYMGQGIKSWNANNFQPYWARKLHRFCTFPYFSNNFGTLRYISNCLQLELFEFKRNVVWGIHSLCTIGWHHRWILCSLDVIEEVLRNKASNLTLPLTAGSNFKFQLFAHLRLHLIYLRSLFPSLCRA